MLVFLCVGVCRRVWVSVCNGGRKEAMMTYILLGSECRPEHVELLFTLEDK